MRRNVERIEPLTTRGYSGNKHSYANNFIKGANVEIDNINLLFSEYKVEKNRNTKLEKLYQINDLRKKLEDEHPQDVYLPDFIEQIEDKLFNACQIEFKKLKISMHEQSLALNHPTNPIPLESPINPFANMLANLGPDDARNMLRLLSGTQSNQPDLNNLYQNSNPEANQITRSHQCIFLGGGNCKNYILTLRNTPNPSQFVLRNDDRLGGARELDTYIRNSPLADIVTPIEAVRSLTLDGKTTTLLITSLCPGGTPEAHSKRCKNDQQRLDGALDIFSQMGTILTRINNENILFPDAKNSNWLLDSQGKVVLADTKALLFSDNGFHDLNVTYEKNKWILGSEPYPITTDQYRPPELYDKRFNVDKMHGFILGQNLYQYLTQCTENKMCYERIDNNHQIIHIPKMANSLDFNKPIFKTETGQKLEKLIRQLIVNDPARRIGAKEATQIINHLKNLPTNRDVATLRETDTSERNVSMPIDILEALIQNKPGSADIEEPSALVKIRSANQEILNQLSAKMYKYDHLMFGYIKQKRFDINQATEAQLTQLQPELQAILKQNTIIDTFIKNTQDKLYASKFQTSVDQKLYLIKASIYNIPVTERGKMMQQPPPSEQISDFQKVLATHRNIFGNWSPISITSNSIFQKHKNRYDGIVTNENLDSQKNDESPGKSS